LLTPISYSMKGSPFFFYTSVVKEEDLLDIETLRHSPMVFQQQIPKLRQLRVIYVDGMLLVMQHLLLSGDVLLEKVAHGKVMNYD